MPQSFSPGAAVPASQNNNVLQALGRGGAEVECHHRFRRPGDSRPCVRSRDALGVDLPVSGSFVLYAAAVLLFSSA